VGLRHGDKTLLYVTGGAAWAKIDSTLAVIGNPIATGVFQSDTRTGWTVGGGLEYALGYAGRPRASSSMSVSAIGTPSPTS